MNNPIKVSVMMPVYNRERYVGEAIESILSQTFTNFELIIVDDGSTDNSLNIINSFSDKRIRVYQNDQNSGIGYTRNRLLELSKGQYLAVLDSDDVAFPNRLEEQVSFLDANEDYGLVGSWAELIDENSRPLKKYYRYKENEEIYSILFFHNFFAHSSVMMRSKIIPFLKYNSEYTPAEDYELFIRIAEKSKVCNLQKPLVKYRIHDMNISDENKNKEILNRQRRILKEQLQKLEVYVSEQELDSLFKISRRFAVSFEELKIAEPIFVSIIKQNAILGLFNKLFFEKYAAYLWTRAGFKSAIKQKKEYNSFVKSELLKYNNYVWIKKIKLFFKCIF